ncbi:hypothetical protein Back11_37770 [Paenibacillus baekrokdamisoli]|uniref:Transposase IS4-like domain-containing protein n=1 Tax=Paenibacillus baekrokdamisoli TaxID=1712516 RepID=A0A3G9IVW9_9BACL|nr:hypothetical protein Back11_37770 [Paenibacillus baekrokdamisoli]
MRVNRHDAPKKELEVYGKRWRIEVFFAKPSKNLALKSATLDPKHSSKHIWSYFLLWKCY